MEGGGHREQAALPVVEVGTWADEPSALESAPSLTGQQTHPASVSPPSNNQSELQTLKVFVQMLPQGFTEVNLWEWLKQNSIHVPQEAIEGYSAGDQQGYYVDLLTFEETAKLVGLDKQRVEGHEIQIDPIPGYDQPQHSRQPAPHVAQALHQPMIRPSQRPPGPGPGRGGLPNVPHAQPRGHFDAGRRPQPRGHYQIQGYMPGQRPRGPAPGWPGPGPGQPFPGPHGHPGRGTNHAMGPPPSMPPPFGGAPGHAPYSMRTDMAPRSQGPPMPAVEHDTKASPLTGRKPLNLAHRTKPIDSQDEQVSQSGIFGGAKPNDPQKMYIEFDIKKRLEGEMAKACDEKDAKIAALLEDKNSLETTCAQLKTRIEELEQQLKSAVQERDDALAAADRNQANAESLQHKLQQAQQKVEHLNSEYQHAHAPVQQQPQNPPPAPQFSQPAQHHMHMPGVHMPVQQGHLAVQLATSMAGPPGLNRDPQQLSRPHQQPENMTIAPAHQHNQMQLLQQLTSQPMHPQWIIPQQPGTQQHGPPDAHPQHVPTATVAVEYPRSPAAAHPHGIAGQHVRLLQRDHQVHLAQHQQPQQQPQQQQQQQQGGAQHGHNLTHHHIQQPLHPQVLQAQQHVSHAAHVQLPGQQVSAQTQNQAHSQPQQPQQQPQQQVQVQQASQQQLTQMSKSPKPQIDKTSRVMQEVQNQLGAGAQQGQQQVAGRHVHAHVSAEGGNFGAAAATPDGEGYSDIGGRSLATDVATENTAIHGGDDHTENGTTPRLSESADHRYEEHAYRGRSRSGLQGRGGYASSRGKPRGAPHVQSQPGGGRSGPLRGRGRQNNPADGEINRRHPHDSAYHHYGGYQDRSSDRGGRGDRGDRPRRSGRHPDGNHGKSPHEIQNSRDNANPHSHARDSRDGRGSRDYHKREAASGTNREGVRHEGSRDGGGGQHRRGDYSRDDKENDSGGRQQLQQQTWEGQGGAGKRGVAVGGRGAVSYASALKSGGPVAEDNNKFAGLGIGGQ